VSSPLRVVFLCYLRGHHGILSYQRRNNHSFTETKNIWPLCKKKSPFGNLLIVMNYKFVSNLISSSVLQGDIIFWLKADYIVLLHYNTPLPIEQDEESFIQKLFIPISCSALPRVVATTSVLWHLLTSARSPCLHKQGSAKKVRRFNCYSDSY
jgi:hypothetical protein